MSSSANVRRTARALFEASLRTGEPERVADDLSAFVAMLDSHADLRKVLTGPAVPPASKRAVVERLLHLRPTSGLVVAFLTLAAERDALRWLPAVADAVRQRLLDHQRVVRADVTTAVPLTSERMEAIQQSLAALTGARVQVAANVDASILGGVVAKVGSRVYDGSVARQLARMRERLTTASH
jgi:F-type H+-transporting ATPase subunit delta